MDQTPLSQQRDHIDPTKRLSSTKLSTMAAIVKDAKGMQAHLYLIDINKIPIKRHVKIRAEATPFVARKCDYPDLVHHHGPLGGKLSLLR